MRIFLLSALIVSQLNLWAVSFEDFDSYQNKLTKAEIQKRLDTFLEKGPEIRKYYSLTEKELRLGEIASEKFDYILQLKVEPEKKTVTKRDLKGARIAIDPGHFGGRWAKLEQRFIYMQTQNPPKTYSFDEGTLTYLTALYLKALLEAEGAIVFLTRSSLDQGSLNENFFQWLETHPEHWHGKESLSQLFRGYYNRLDMAHRAELINEFNPDITLILHYNASSGVENKPSNAYTTPSNYNLVFIPGSFKKSDLDLVEDRYHFLRLLVSDHLDESLLLSKHIAKAFTQELKVPLIPDANNGYEPNVCIKQTEGIYSRNLFLTRSIKSPLCYGETLIQNNPEEMDRLSSLETEVAGIACSKRVLEVAQAYYKGIKNYFKRSPLKEPQKKPQDSLTRSKNPKAKTKTIR